MNYFTWYTSDDFVYRFIYKAEFPNGHEEHVRNLYDLIVSQINHWRVWNGRFTAHSIVQIFMQFPKIVFDVVNSLAFLSLGLLINGLSCYFANEQSKKYQAFYVAVIFLVLWWFLPEIGKTVLWVSGAGNYLWTAVIDLVWISLFINRNIPIYVSLPLAFFAGAGNENTSLAMIILLALFFGYHCWDKKRIILNKATELLSACCGFLLMLSSPGSQKRAGHVSIFDHFFTKVIYLFHTSLVKYWILYLLLFSLLCYALVKKYMNRQQLISVIFLFLAHLACIYSLVAINERPDRVFFGSSVLLCLLVLILLRIVGEREIRLKKLAMLLLVPFLMTFGFSYVHVIQDIHQTYEVVSAQYRQIEEAKKKGLAIVTLKRFPKPHTLFNAYYETNNLGYSKNDWFNQWMAKYFGVDGIESVD